MSGLDELCCGAALRQSCLAHTCPGALSQVIPQCWRKEPLPSQSQALRGAQPCEYLSCFKRHELACAELDINFFMPIFRDCKSFENNEIQFEASDFYLVYRDRFGSKEAFFGSREAK